MAENTKFVNTNNKVFHFETSEKSQNVKLLQQNNPLKATRICGSVINLMYQLILFPTEFHKKSSECYSIVA